MANKVALHGGCEAPEVDFENIDKLDAGLISSALDVSHNVFIMRPGYSSEDSVEAAATFEKKAASLYASSTLDNVGNVFGEDYDYAPSSFNACKQMLLVLIQVLHSLAAGGIMEQAFKSAQKSGHYNAIFRRDAAKWADDQQTHHRLKIKKFLEPLILRIVNRNGGHKLWLKAGYEARLAVWYHHFRKFPATICHLVFEHTKDVFPFEQIFTMDDDSAMVKAWRDWIMYQFRELCEEAFQFKFSLELTYQENKQRVDNWRAMFLGNPNFAILKNAGVGLDILTWPAKQPVSAGKDVLKRYNAELNAGSKKKLAEAYARKRAAQESGNTALSKRARTLTS